MDKDHLKEDTLKNLRSVTLSCKLGVPINRLQKDYESIIGTRIPFQALGYSTLQDFLKELPDVVKLKKTSNGELVVEGVPDSSTAHIAKLIYKQRDVKPKPVPESRSKFPPRKVVLTPPPSSSNPPISCDDKYGKPVPESRSKFPPRRTLLPSPSSSSNPPISYNDNNRNQVPGLRQPRRALLPTPTFIPYDERDRVIRDLEIRLYEEMRRNGVLHTEVNQLNRSIKNIKNSHIAEQKMGERNELEISQKLKNLQIELQKEKQRNEEIQSENAYLKSQLKTLQGA